MSVEFPPTPAENGKAGRKSEIRNSRFGSKNETRSLDQKITASVLHYWFVDMERFGKYILVDKISSGGMADVYRAKVLGIRGFTKTVAIKRIHPHLLERTRFLRMFTDEAKISSRLVHPNIVQIYDLGEADGTPFIAMEYVAGRDLFRVLQRLGSLDRRCPWRLATRSVTEV